MDQQRFDSLTRSLAQRLTRRTAVGRLAAGGAAAVVATTALTAGGRRVAAQEETPAAAGELPEGVCAVPFEAVVRSGPNAGQEHRGLLVLKVGPDGAIDGGALIPRGAEPVSVVGQATGRAVSLLFTVADGQYLFGTGTAETPLSAGACQGQMGGPFVGPQPGDFGDWLTCDCETNPTCPACTGDGTPDPAGCGLVACQSDCYATQAGPALTSCLVGCRRTQGLCA